MRQEGFRGLLKEKQTMNVIEGGQTRCDTGMASRMNKRRRVGFTKWQRQDTGEYKMAEVGCR